MAKIEAAYKKIAAGEELTADENALLRKAERDKASVILTE